MELAGVMQLKKNELLFFPGKKADHLYMLYEGFIKVFNVHEDGREEEIALFAPGDIIGDFDFARGAEYNAHAEAIEDSSLVVFPDVDLTLDDIAMEEPHIVSKLLLNSAAMVTGRIKSTRKLLINNISWVQELHRKAYEDPGTGLWKQTFLNDEINRLLTDPMALIMLKPDRFKILVDDQGHETGDTAMIKIAAILKNITRKLGRGWALRFKSNETGLLINKCNETEAEALVRFLSDSIAAMPPVYLKKTDEHGKSIFSFSGSIAWGIWPLDNKSWDSLFNGTYQLLMDTWKEGGKKNARYHKEYSP